MNSSTSNFKGKSALQLNQSFRHLPTANILGESMSAINRDKVSILASKNQPTKSPPSLASTHTQPHKRKPLISQYAMTSVYTCKQKSRMMNEYEEESPPSPEPVEDEEPETSLSNLKDQNKFSIVVPPNDKNFIENTSQSVCFYSSYSMDHPPSADQLSRDFSATSISNYPGTQSSINSSFSMIASSKDSNLDFIPRPRPLAKKKKSISFTFPKESYKGPSSVSSSQDNQEKFRDPFLSEVPGKWKRKSIPENVGKTQPARSKQSKPPVKFDVESYDFSRDSSFPGIQSVHELNANAYKSSTYLLLNPNPEKDHRGCYYFLPSQTKNEDQLFPHSYSVLPPRKWPSSHSPKDHTPILRDSAMSLTRASTHGREKVALQAEQIQSSRIAWAADNDQVSTSKEEGTKMELKSGTQTRMDVESNGSSASSLGNVPETHWASQMKWIKRRDNEETVHFESRSLDESDRHLEGSKASETLEKGPLYDFPEDGAVLDDAAALQKQVEQLLLKNKYYSDLINGLLSSHSHMLRRRLETRANITLQKHRRLQEKIRLIAEKRFEQKQQQRKQSGVFI